MKKYIQSLLSFLFIFSMPFIIHKGMLLYKDPLNFIENPLVWYVIILFGLVVFMKEVVLFSATERAKKLQMQKEGLAYEKPDFFAWYKKLIKYWTVAKPTEEVEIILDHNYDGIRELNNALPPWWKNLFYITILFAVVYLVRFEVLDGPTPADEYEEEVAIARRELEAYRATAVDAFNLDEATLLTAEADLNRGKAVFNLNCASCHLKDGGGSIGPNLTDEYWILGGGFKNVVSTLMNGGRDGKGMISWNKTLKPADIAKVASYVISFQGTTPKKAKKPQGELWVEKTVEKTAEK